MGKIEDIFDYGKMWRFVDVRKYGEVVMSDMNLMIFMDCGVLDSIFFDLFDIVSMDL